MSVPRLHHYLSQFYLKGFTRDDMLWVYDRQKDAYRSQHPKKTAAINDFYSIEGEDGELDPELEIKLSHIEAKTKPIIAALDEWKDITPEDSVYLSAFLAILHSRVPKFEREITEIADQATKAILKRMIPHADAAREHLRRRGKKDIDPEHMADFVQNERFTVKGHRNNAIVTMLRQWPELAKLFNEENKINVNLMPFDVRADFVKITSDTVLVPGHGPLSTFGEERRSNPFVADSVFG